MNKNAEENAFHVPWLKARHNISAKLTFLLNTAKYFCVNIAKSFIFRHKGTNLLLKHAVHKTVFKMQKLQSSSRCLQLVCIEFVNDFLKED